jgi:hypothetical protein
MEFRTEIEPLRHQQRISHNDAIVMLGSCFTDNIGALLNRDGFDVWHNEMGVLYNPLSIAQVVNRALSNTPYTIDDLYEYDGVWHCLDFESRRQSSDAELLLQQLNRDFAQMRQHLIDADVWIVTFGTAWIFDHIATNRVAGNCHKLPSAEFVRRRISVDEIVRAWQPLCKDKRIIFTVSPIRHLADGLHGNQLSKATLLLATEQLGEYFPAYEILCDDLRDYRFYAEDMKHPSETAINYIYNIFEQSYFDKETSRKALECRRIFARQNHRQII